MPSWELVFLARLAGDEDIQVAPPGKTRVLDRRIGRVTVTETMTALGPPDAWWPQRASAVRVLLDRALDRLANPPREGRDRPHLAHFAVLLAATVLAEEPRQRGRDPILRRLRKLQEAERLTAPVRSAVAKVIDGSLAPAHDGAAGQLEMTLVEASGADWLSAAVHAALLWDDDEEPAPLEAAIGERLRSGLRETVTRRKERHAALREVLSGANNRDLTRALLSRAALDALRGADERDARKFDLAWAMVGLCVVDQKAGGTSYRTVHWKALKAIAAWRQAGDLAAAAARLVRRGPGVPPEELIEALWDADPTGSKVGPTASGEVPADTQISDEASDRAGRYTLRRDADTMRVLLNGKKLRYARGNKQSTISARHSAIRYIVNRQSRARARVPRATPWSEFTSAVHDATDGELDLDTDHPSAAEHFTIDKTLADLVRTLGAKRRPR